MGRPRPEVAQASVDDFTHFWLEDGHLPPGEPRVDQLAQLTVPGRVSEDEVALLNRVRHHGVGDSDALRRRELVRICGNVANVLVFQQGPELRHVVPADRRGRAQLLVRRVWVAREEVRGMQRDRRLHGCLPRHKWYRTVRHSLSDFYCVYSARM